MNLICSLKDLRLSKRNFLSTSSPISPHSGLPLSGDQMVRCSRQREASRVCYDSISYQGKVTSIVHRSKHCPGPRIFFQVPRIKMIFWWSFRYLATARWGISVPWLPGDVYWFVWEWKIRVQYWPGVLSYFGLDPNFRSYPRGPSEASLIQGWKYGSVSAQGWTQNSHGSALSVLGGAPASAEWPPGSLRAGRCPQEAWVKS